MPFMQPSRQRLICRSHNPFTPSVALWQHFVLPNRPVPFQQRLYSSSTEPKPLETPPQHDSPGNITTEIPQSPPRNAPPVKIARNGHSSDTSSASADGSHTGPDDVLKGNGLSRPPVKANVKRQGVRGAPNATVQTPKPGLVYALSKEDYEGQVVTPIAVSNAGYQTPEQALPWVAPTRYRKDGIVALSLEMKNFHEFMKPKQSEKLARQRVIDQIQEHVKERFPGAVLETFGSERTGLAFAISDIDIRLISVDGADKSRMSRPSAPSQKAQSKLRTDLEKLTWHFRKKRSDYMLCELRHARYPLMAMQERISGLEIQIVSANDTASQRQKMQQYIEEYPFLPQLYSVLKATLDIRGLSDVFRGGIGSYPLFMMIVGFLKTEKTPVPDAGVALMKFLNFWSRFDTYNYGITIEPPTVFSKGDKQIMSPRTKDKLEKHPEQRLPPFVLSLEDPNDPFNDLGRKGICIKHAQATFRYLHGIMQQRVTSPTTQKSLIGPLVGAIKGQHAAQRSRLEAYGRRLLQQEWIRLAAEAKAIREGSSDQAADTVAKPAEQVKTSEDEARALAADQANVVESFSGGPAGGDLQGNRTTAGDEALSNTVQETEAVLVEKGPGVAEQKSLSGKLEVDPQPLPKKAEV